jgi:hypothetical protein
MDGTVAKVPTLDELLKEAGLADKVAPVDKNVVRLQYNSAYVIVGVSGSALVVIAPLFRALPTGKEAAFFKKLLEHNATMGGIASFAVQPDGWVVLQAGRPIKGVDAEEFATLVVAVGKFADELDDKLIKEFYVDQPDATNQAPLDDEPDDAAAPATA